MVRSPKISVTPSECLHEPGPVWSPGLTKHEIMQIERVQKAALYIILGEKYSEYLVSARSLKLHTLEDRRNTICGKFTKKAVRNPKFSDWFVEQDQTHNMRTRNKKNLFKEVKCRTERYQKSPLPYLTNILNQCD